MPRYKGQKNGTGSKIDGKRVNCGMEVKIPSLAEARKKVLEDKKKSREKQIQYREETPLREERIAQKKAQAEENKKIKEAERIEKIRQEEDRIRLVNERAVEKDVEKNGPFPEYEEILSIFPKDKNGEYNFKQVLDFTEALPQIKRPRGHPITKRQGTTTSTENRGRATSYLTRALAIKIFQHAFLLSPLKYTAKAVGITPSTLHNWLERGKETIEEGTERDTIQKGLYAYLYRNHEKFRALGVIARHQRIFAEGDPKTLLQQLERYDPKIYGPVKNKEVTINQKVSLEEKKTTVHAYINLGELPPEKQAKILDELPMELKLKMLAEMEKQQQVVIEHKPDLPEKE